MPSKSYVKETKTKEVKSYVISDPSIPYLRLQIYRIVVLKKDDENNLDRAYKKRGPFNENGSKKSTYTFPQFS